MKTLAYALIIGFIILALLTFYFGIKAKGRRIFIGFIYVFCFVYTIGVSIFYANYITTESPDESAHIGYIYHLEQTGEIIPKYEDMHIFASMIMKWSELPNYEYQEATVNYLCHPPLYYHIMRLAGGFAPTESPVVVTIDKLHLRYFSLIIASIGLLLTLYIGYSRLPKSKPWAHLLYAVTVTSIPMMSYEMCAVTNDSLSIVTAAICILGLLRFTEGKRDVLTYILIALGISGSLLTKLTAAMLCIIMALIVLVVTIIKERSIKNAFKIGFLFSLPIYAVAVAYYVIIYMRYGTFQPSLELIAGSEYFQQTIYYVAESERTVYTFSEYIGYYFERFFLSWSGIESISRYLKSYTYSLSALPYELLWVVPVMFVLPIIRKKAGGLTLPTVAGYVAIIVTFLYQFKSAYGSYLTRGYLGGFASRYYLPFVSIFGLGLVLVLKGMLIDNGFDSETEVLSIKDDFNTFRKNLLFNQLIYAIGLGYAFVLFYGSFPFFLLHFA